MMSWSVAVSTLSGDDDVITNHVTVPFCFITREIVMFQPRKALISPIG